MFRLKEYKLVERTSRLVRDGIQLLQQCGFLAVVVVVFQLNFVFEFCSLQHTDLCGKGLHLINISLWWWLLLPLLLLHLHGVFNAPVCEETFRASSGTLQSPANTGGRRQCTFIIEQWQGYLVHLQFTHFNLGDGSDNCQNTYLEVGAQWRLCSHCWLCWVFYRCVQWGSDGYWRLQTEYLTGVYSGVLMGTEGSRLNTLRCVQWGSDGYGGLQTEYFTVCTVGFWWARRAPDWILYSVYSGVLMGTEGSRLTPGQH